jgi:hypothetical protein
MKARQLSVLALIAIVFFVSCQKDDITATDYITETSEHADDQSRFSEEEDGVANDANAVIEVTSGFTGRTGDVQSLICDATVTLDTLSNPRTITIVYNGLNCLGNRTRTGTVVISMAAGMRWRQAGAILNVSFQNLKVTRVSDNKSITINGTQVYTNVSGGLLFNLASAGSIIHTITSSNMSITFDNGSQRTWQVARRRVFTYNNGIVITTTGTHTDGATTGIAEWGANRFGHDFTTAITQPLVIRQDCNFRLVSGKVAHHTSLFNATAIFGLDSTGNPTSCPGSGNYFLKLEWTGPSGIHRTVILPY